MYKIIIPDYVPRPKARHRDGKEKVVTTAKMQGGKWVLENKTKKHKWTPTAESEKSLSYFITSYMNVKYPGWKRIEDEKIFMHLTVFSKKRLPGDRTNYEKFVEDALEKSGLIKNDWWIRDGGSTILENEKQNRTEIIIYPIAKKSPDHQKIFSLRREFYSIRAIAKSLGISKGRVQRVLGTAGTPLEVKGLDGKKYSS